MTAASIPSLPIRCGLEGNVVMRASATNGQVAALAQYLSFPKGTV